MVADMILYSCPRLKPLPARLHLQYPYIQRFLCPGGVSPAPDSSAMRLRKLRSTSQVGGQGYELRV